MTVHVTRAGDFLTALPYQIGFHPARSLVVAVTRESTVSVIARMDVPAHPVHAEFFVDDGCARLGRQIRACDGDGAHLVLYDDSPLGMATLVRVGDWLTEIGLDIGLAAAVCGDVFWQLGVVEGDWQLLPRPQDVALVAELVALGRSVAPDRETAMARLAPGPYVADAGRDLTPRERSVPVQAIAEWRALLALGAPDEPDAWQPSAQAAVRLARSLLDRDFRDALVAKLVPGTLPDSDLVEPAAGRAMRLLEPLTLQLRGHRRARGEPLWHGTDLQLASLREIFERLLVVARSAPAPIAAGPYAVAAILAGRLGEGLMCAAAVAQALKADPDHILANIMADAIEAGLVPGRPMGHSAADPGAA